MTSMKDDSVSNLTKFHKVFWVGRHPRFISQRTGKPLVSPLGRMPSSLMKLMTQEYGWEEIKNFEDDFRLPIITFCGRRPTDDFYPTKYPAEKSDITSNDLYALAYDTNDCNMCNEEIELKESNAKEVSVNINTKQNNIVAHPNHRMNESHYISQLTSKITEHVDCKLRLWKHLKRAYHDYEGTLMNPYVDRYTKFLEKNIPFPFTLQWDDLKMIVETNFNYTGLNNPSKPLVWFVKHKNGVKGQAVHVFKDLNTAYEWLLQINKKATKPNIKPDTNAIQKSCLTPADDYVIQQEVHPPMILNNHKFVIRAHVLLTLDNLNDRTIFNDNVYLNKNMICLEYGDELDDESKTTSVELDPSQYISSCGKKNSRLNPYLISGNLYSKIFPQMVDIVSVIHRHVHLECMIPSIAEIQNNNLITEKSCKGAITRRNSSNETISNLHHYHLFGYDFMVTKEFKLVLLEVNANPAIASGTMKDVPKNVYHQLLLDVLNLVVLPVTNGAKKELGDFVSCIDN